MVFKMYDLTFKIKNEVVPEYITNKVTFNTKVNSRLLKDFVNPSDDIKACNSLIFKIKLKFVEPYHLK